MRAAMVLGLLILTASTAASGAASAVPAVSIPFEKYTLANGLQVTLVEDRRLPLVATNLRYFVGSANDPPGRTGFAHLFEHLYAFSTPEGYPTLQAAGATQDGATTEPDRTTYYTTVPSSQLELYLALESDVLRRFPARLDAALLARERANVRNERRLVIENEPYGLADEAVFQQLFPQGHPYHARYVGSHVDIEAVRLDEARQFFERYYVPNNASLVIAGDIDKSRTKRLIDKYFGAIPAGRSVSRIHATVPVIKSEKRVTVTDRIESPRLSMAWVTPGWYEPGNAEAELLAIILGKGSSSRLQQRLVREQHLAQEIVVEHLPFAQASVLVIKATASEGVELPNLERALDEELANLRRKGPTAEEVERARNTVELQIVRGLEKLGEITAFGDFTADGVYGGVAEQLNQCNHLRNDPGCLAPVLGRYREMTSARLRDIAASTLSQQSRVVLYAVPGEKVVNDVPVGEVPAAEAAPSPRMEEAQFESPAAGPASAIALPAVQKFALANGMTVLLAEQHHLPVVTAQLVVRGGSGASPPEQPGLAAFTVEMLVRGTSKRDTLQIAGDVARLGSSLDTDISSDASALSIRVLKPNLDSAIGLLADVARHPQFPQPEVARLRASQLARLTQLRTNADTLASYLFTEAIYGRGGRYRTSGLFNDDMFARTHRYGYDEFGTQRSLSGLQRADLLRFWRDYYAPGNVALVVAGDVSRVELQERVAKYFGDWSAVARTPPSVVPASAPSRSIVIADVGESSQTALRVGTIGLARGNPDQVAARMLNIVLGELYASRITGNLRGRNGYTYMARSQFAFRREPGPFVIGTNVRTDATAAAIRELFGEIERIRAEPVTADELSFARHAFSSSLVGLFQTTASVATGLGQIFTYDLLPHYYGDLQRQISVTGVEEIQRTARRYLVPQNLVVVAVGDRAQIESSLAQLQWGPVEIQDVH